MAAQANTRSVTDLISFLEGTLIPDLRDSGQECIADDFEECVGFMRPAPVESPASGRVTRHFSIGIDDDSGRLIGAFAEVGPVYYRPESGERCVRVQPTRNGRGFGGSVPLVIIDGGPEAEEREVQRRLKNMCKSYSRKFGDGGKLIPVLIVD